MTHKRPRLHFFYNDIASCSINIRRTKAYEKQLEDYYPPVICKDCFSIAVKNFNELVKDGLYNYIYK